jgi:arachidonate 15-lipoxygenase
MLVKDLPAHENFSTRYQLLRGKGVAELLANMLATRVESLFDPFDRLEDYEELFPVLPKPTSAKNWRSDSMFAYQRLAGVNPMVIRGIDRLPDNFKVTDADFQKAMGPDKTLAQEAAAGHLFLADYAPLHNLTLGTYRGHLKIVTAPLVLYCWRSRGLSGPGSLVPVAIQLYQNPGDGHTTPRHLYTPADGRNWTAAKIFAQIADGNHHELVTHLGRTHLVIEAFILATMAELAPNHPLAILLRPHFQFTLAINTLAEGELINPGGFVDRLLAGTLEASLEVARQGYEEALRNFSEFALPIELQNRAIDSPDRLPDYPYRDDALPVWQAIETFVRGYLTLYYTDPNAIVNDSELQAWARRLMNPTDAAVPVGLIPGGNLTTLDQLIRIATQIIFTAGPQHGAVNYPQYDFLAFAPNMPLSAYVSPPDAGEVDQNYILRLLPPQEQAVHQLQVMQTLTAFRYNRLGYYPANTFSDARVRPLLALFQRQLAVIDNTIDRRNINDSIDPRTFQRLAPYIFLKPSLIPNSIHI